MVILMYIVHVSLFFMFLNNVLSQEDNGDWLVAKKLREMIMCKLDKNTRPSSHYPNKTEIDTFITPFTLEFVEDSSSIRLQTWIELLWSDHNLSWDDNEYSNKSMLIVDASKIWIPDLFLYNWKNKLVILDQICTEVYIGSIGWLYTSAVPVLNGYCVPDWTNWPLDTQNCEIHLTSRKYTTDEVDFKLDASYKGYSKGLYMEDYTPSRVWELKEMKAEKINTPVAKVNGTDVFRADIKIYIQIKRHASVFISSYVMPGFVMTVLSLSSLWFSPTHPQRIPVICLLAFLQMLYLLYLSYKIPSNGAKIPRIVVFYGGSLLISTTLLILTVLSRSISSFKTKPSSISEILRKLESYDRINFFKFSDVKENENSTSSQPNEWQQLVLFINKAAFIILCPIYTVLFLHFIL